MEGLLPLVFKSIKKKSIRRQYNHLSTEKAVSTAAAAAQSYNISDFYADGYNYHYPTKTLPHQPLQKSNTFNGSSAGGARDQGQHRRHNSHIGEYYYSSHNSSSAAVTSNGLPPTSEEEEEAAARIGRPNQQLVRFRSLRFLPSCVTGAA